MGQPSAKGLLKNVFKALIQSSFHANRCTLPLGGTSGYCNRACSESYTPTGLRGCGRGGHFVPLTRTALATCLQLEGWYLTCRKMEHRAAISIFSMEARPVEAEDPAGLQRSELGLDCRPPFHTKDEHTSRNPQATLWLVLLYWALALHPHKLSPLAQLSPCRCLSRFLLHLQ